MNRIKLILTDFDGTFCDFYKEPPSEEAMVTKKRLMEQDIKVVLVSGRSIKETKQLIEKYDFSNMSIAELGTVIDIQGRDIINHGDLRNYKGSPKYDEFVSYLDTEKNTAHDSIFKIGVIDVLLNEAKKKQHQLQIFTPKDGRPGDLDNNIMQKKGSVLLRGYTSTWELNKILSRDTPFIEIIDNGGSGEKNDHRYHVVIKGANKQTGAQLLQKELEISSEETVAVGDSFADLFLSFTVGKFILMKNAFNHSPRILDDFQIALESLPKEESKKILEEIQITKKEQSLGWAETVGELL